MVCEFIFQRLFHLILCSIGLLLFHVQAPCCLTTALPIFSSSTVALISSWISCLCSLPWALLNLGTSRLPRPALPPGNSSHQYFMTQACLSSFHRSLCFSLSSHSYCYSCLCNLLVRRFLVLQHFSCLQDLKLPLNRFQGQPKFAAVLIQSNVVDAQPSA